MADGAGNWVFRISLHRGSHGQSVMRLKIRRGDNVYNANLALGQGARLVKDDDVQIFGRFHRLPVANQDTILGPQGSRVGDDQRHG